MQVKLDYTNVLAEHVGEEHGISLDKLHSLCDASSPAVEALKQRMHRLNQKGPRAPAHSAEVA